MLIGVYQLGLLGRVAMHALDGPSPGSVLSRLIVDPPMFPWHAWDWGFSGVSVANSGLPACGEMSGHERPRPAKLPCTEYGRDLLRRIFFVCDRAAWSAIW